MGGKANVYVTKETKGQVIDVVIGLFTCGFHLLCCPFTHLTITIRHDADLPLKVTVTDGSGGVREEFVIPPGKTYRTEIPYRPENMDILKGTLDPYKFEFEDKRELTVVRGGSGAARSSIS